MLVKITKEEYEKLENYYGNMWYTKFFNTYHINSSIFLIKESQTQKEEIIEKYGQKWYDEHIASKQLVEKKLIYSYEALIKDERTRKNTKKGRNSAIGEDDEFTDYTLSKKVDINKIFAKNSQSREQITSSTISDSSDESITDSSYSITPISISKDIDTVQQTENQLELEESELKDDVESELEENEGKLCLGHTCKKRSRSKNYNLMKRERKNSFVQKRKKKTSFFFYMKKSKKLGKDFPHS